MNATGAYKPKVLVIDDEKAMASSIIRALRRHDCICQWAQSGYEVGAVLSSYMPDVVTLDLRIPGMSGLEILNYIRSHEALRHIKVILVTGMPASVIPQQAIAMADSVLGKPFEIDDLTALILSTDTLKDC
jgi:CheY-like chemotaxis protein